MQNKQISKRLSLALGISLDKEGWASVAEVATPPPVLYHGTGAQNLTSILIEGLQRRTRQHVHLSQDPETAFKVGSRHGKAIILTVQSGPMHQAGYPFYYSANGVWLTEAVPAIYIELKKDLQ